MTPRLTAPQLAVLRALDKLPDGEWITAKDGGFSAGAAVNLAFRGPDDFSFIVTRWDRKDERYSYRLSFAGLALVRALKSEGKL